ncbi:MAG: glycerophosphoryl diester phosphodiesterase membrane domain-containing protein [Atopobiaceae bacterium]|nr:glycerophosphoryl diester phosphodiesterase membrane domain-containing protein [Atopobiaceae bacterium]
MHPIRSTNAYIKTIPFVIMYQLTTSFVLWGLGSILKMLAGLALISQGRVAVTTGDFMFLFTTWQGWILILLALVMLWLFVSLELIGMVTYANYWAQGKRIRVRDVLRDAFASSTKLISPAGVLVVLYTVLILPLLNLGTTVSLTEKLYIPSFIMSVVNATPTYKVLYHAVIIFFTLVGIFGMFLFQGIVVDDLPVTKAYVRSFDLVRTHWLHILGQILLLLLNFAIMAALICVLVPIIGCIVATLLTGIQEERFITIVFAGMTLVGSVIVLAASSTILTLKLTVLYRAYTTNNEVVVGVPGKSGIVPLTLMWLIALVCCVPVSVLAHENFNEIFKPKSEVKVIAHRAGGNEAPENCVAGLDKAVETGSWGAEIDIQRTSDGHYIVNHDDNFKRIAGDPRKPSDVTLEEATQLIIRNPDGTPTGEHIATYEEMLDGARDRVVLFVELKGKTADKQMADDAVRIAREKGMLDQCVFISLKYDLINYLETNYDDVKAGFLEFASYGNTALLDCDYLAVEEEVATADTINAVHEQDKMLFVWTPNTYAEQWHFLDSDCDAIITDNMSQAAEVKADLAKRSDVDLIMDKLLDTFTGEAA